jgi:hypothetical protein
LELVVLVAAELRDHSKLQPIQVIMEIHQHVVLQVQVVDMVLKTLVEVLLLIQQEV